MFSTLITYLEKGSSLSEKDIALLHAVFLPKTVKKGEFILREGEIARYGTFVAKGFLRSYVIDQKGREHIIQFAPENWWISDKQGMGKEAPASFFIDALEDSELLMIDLEGHFTLMKEVAAYAAVFQSGMQKRGAAKDQRIVDTLTATAEERYNEFLDKYPSIAQRVPQHMLASYLGITPETLSRIRKLQSQRK